MRTLRTRLIIAMTAAASIAALSGAVVSSQGDASSWTQHFLIERDELRSTGRNPYFVLEPGYELVLEDGDERLTITVLSQTRNVAGVETRVVEERETKGGALVEVSRNYFAISARTNSVFYFGEEVDMYRNGRVVSHEGAWLSGANGARFGLMMPGVPLVHGRYYQEIAPGVAMDRARILSTTGTLSTPAGSFTNVLRTEETTPLEPREREYKYYAPGVGLLQDGSLKLVRYGRARVAP
jgi:hypothetical protein